MEDLASSEAEKYQILEELGEERWGKVFRASSGESGGDVLLQVLDQPWVSQPGNRQHISQIAKAAVRWRHKGITRILDIRESQASTILVREFIPGNNLRDLMEVLRENKKSIPIVEALHVTVQVLAALDYLHQRGFVHGELVPQNIFLREEGSEGLPFQPVLVNAGLHEPSSNYRFENPAYEPPELAAGGKYDLRSDIYCAGMLLYELATGKAPSFETAAVGDRSDMLGAGKPALRLPHTLRPDFPVAVEQIILKATAQEPDKRFAGSASMIDSLSEAVRDLARKATTPQGAEDTASLLWALKTSLPAVEAAAMNEGDQPAKPGETELESIQDRIHILLADKTIHTILFKPPAMTIGRGNDNDIVLNQPGVSRHHARIEYDGSSYRIIDLDSRNGTYIGETRLKPGSAQSWNPGENARVGDTWLRLERISQEVSTVAQVDPSARAEDQETLIEPDFKLVHPDGGGIDLSQVKFSPGKAFLGVYLETPALTVPPGGQVTSSLTLINQSPENDNFRITFIGVPLDWIPNRPQSIAMQPTSQRHVPLTFQAIRSAESRAGHHILTIRVASQKDTSQVVEVRLAITISAFAQFSSEIKPARLKPGAVGQVAIRNMGNLPETYTVGWDTKFGELTFTPPTAKITLPPGNSGTINFQAKSSQRSIYGGENLLTYGVVVSSQSGQFQTHKGEFANKPLIPGWAPVAMLVLCLVLACGALLFFNQVTLPARRAQETETANLTASALETLASQAASTATAQSFADATEISGQAATATANWFLADDDQDGLPNSQEALFNTKPDQPDTDLDGLKDGDEVQLYKTNPLMTDTDGDGLSDGVEVQNKTDPLRRDTDGDGLDDAVDPDPFLASTATATQTIPTGTPTRPADTPIPTTDLSILLDSGVASAVPGASMSYTIRIRNNGPSHVSNAQVIDTFPDALVNISWTCTATSGSFCRGSNGFGNLNKLVDVLVGGEITYIISGSVSPGATGSMVNSASITAPAGFVETNSSNNVSTETVALTPKVSFNLSITDNRTEISPGETNVYTIIATNSGPSTAVGVVITNIIPDSLTSLSWTCTASGGSYCSPGGTQSGNVSASGTIRPGGSLSITLNTRVKDDSLGTISNTAYLSSPVDPSQNNKSATDVTTILPAAGAVMELESPKFAWVHFAASSKIIIQSTPVLVTDHSSTCGTPLNALLFTVRSSISSCSCSLAV